MAFLILQRIQNGSEQASDLLKGQITKLEISKIQGEDVEQVVSLIESTHRVLKCSSTKSRACVPQDFSKTVHFKCIRLHLHLSSTLSSNAGKWSCR